MQELQQLYDKMVEYTKMTDELPFSEFNEYYQKVMAFLQKDYQELGQDELITVKGICTIMFMNAQARSMKKDENRKKFHKIAEKCNFWQDAIKSRLHKEGLSDKEITDREEALWADETDETNVQAN
jgi:hypothetical protein